MPQQSSRPLRAVTCSAGFCAVCGARKLRGSQGRHSWPHVCRGNHPRAICHAAVLCAAAALMLQLADCIYKVAGHRQQHLPVPTILLQKRLGIAKATLHSIKVRDIVR